MKFLPPHKAWVVRESASGFSGKLEDRLSETRREGHVVIQTHYSALNYKDALSASGHKGITLKYPHIPGIDSVGEIIYSPTSKFSKGQSVVVTGYDLGMNAFGGWSEVVQVPEAWVIVIPKQLSLREVAILGTAGLTAGLALNRLLNEGLSPEKGSVVVTGATGGVGSMSIALMHQCGYEVIAVTGKQHSVDYLREIGATEVLMREEMMNVSDRVLLKSRWAGAIDTVGGRVLSSIIRQIKPRGAIAMCGLAQSDQLQTSVYPFILRGISLLGIDSAEQPLAVKEKLWNAFAHEWRLQLLDSMYRVAHPNQIATDISLMLEGRSTGRTIYDWRSIANETG